MTLTVANVNVSNGTATIAYADLKQAITDLNPESRFTELAVSYASNGGDVEKNGFGIKTLSGDVMGPPPADTLTVTFDDNADTVTIGGMMIQM